MVEPAAVLLPGRLPAAARVCRGRGAAAAAVAAAAAASAAAAVAAAAVVSELLDEVHHHFGLGHRVLLLRSLRRRRSPFSSSIGRRFGAGMPPACCWGLQTVLFTESKELGLVFPLFQLLSIPSQLPSRTLMCKGLVTFSVSPNFCAQQLAYHKGQKLKLAVQCKV